ncbi:hypothetical protein PCANB_001439 [Pneumocystis canis]|nr:hypothetical protein PCANB_001439 [Pneumocystis canis]
MLSDIESLKTAFLYWINTFNTEDTMYAIHSLDELCDGIVVYRILIEIDPIFFRNAIGATPVENGPSNWVLRLNNVKRIYKYLTRYYEEQLKWHLPDVNKHIPNLEAIAKDLSEEETIKFLKLILTSSILSNQHEKYVKKIQNLDTEIQTILKKAIQEVMESKEENIKNIEEENNLQQTENNVAILNKEKNILKKNYEIILEENITLRQDQQTMRSKLNAVSEKLNEAKEIIENYKYQVNDLQAQLNQFESKLHECEEELAQKNSEMEQQNISITSLTYENEKLTEKINEITLLKSNFHKESIGISKNALKYYYEESEKNPFILHQNEISFTKEIQHKDTDEKDTLINNEDIVKDHESELESFETPYNQSIKNKETLEQKIKHSKEHTNIIKIKENEIQPLDEKVIESGLSENILHESVKYSEHSDNELKSPLNTNFELKESDKELNTLKEESSKKNPQSANKYEHNFSKDFLSNSSLTYTPSPLNSKIQTHESENLFDLEKIESIKLENNIYTLDQAHKTNNLIKLQAELEELKKNIRNFENENQSQMNLINKLHAEKNTLIQKSVDNESLLSKLQQENSKLNSIITSISKTTDEERRKRLETQEELEKLQNELDQKITAALKAKELLKKQNTIIQGLKEKTLSENMGKLYNELALKNKQIEELKKTNNEEITKLKKENIRMTNAWYKLASHMQQNDSITQHPSVSP